MTAYDSRFLYQPDPDNPGWHQWRLRDEGRFNALFGNLLVRGDGARAIVRLTPHHRLSNFQDRLHGGALMGFIDCALFAGASTLGSAGALTGVTVDLSVQMAGAADPGHPVDAIVEVTRETGRLLFLRGTVEQGDAMIAGYIATIRKARS
ncbi:PaaI family thioesterase [Rhizorhabdus dicambivorans]|uniref:PaaI family thioesterase n=1 Tax=Rhizorhabdus dicambivorans TaxID=1850238 RepID=A0A2A4FUW4_9SPHN|nr:PaaI family thioesterase [Rhizorhabdus dicambivorans]ATE64413.1 PaaI family thioesterase [Rhizorhabdus dicambivorans]PCE41238.1 PaaI family thioesterase [Rhizorhabdus dicambivorans]